MVRGVSDGEPAVDSACRSADEIRKPATSRTATRTTAAPIPMAQFLLVSGGVYVGGGIQACGGGTVRPGFVAVGRSAAGGPYVGGGPDGAARGADAVLPSRPAQ